MYYFTGWRLDTATFERDLMFELSFLWINSIFLTLFCFLYSLLLLLLIMIMTIIVLFIIDCDDQDHDDGDGGGDGDGDGDILYMPPTHTESWGSQSNPYVHNHGNTPIPQNHGNTPNNQNIGNTPLGQNHGIQNAATPINQNATRNLQVFAR